MHTCNERTLCSSMLGDGDHTACQETAMLFICSIVECRQALLCWVCMGYAYDIPSDVSSSVGGLISPPPPLFDTDICHSAHGR